MKEPLDYHGQRVTRDVGDRPTYLEIDTAKNRRWMGWTAYILLFLSVAVALVFLFIRFAGSIAIAVLLVGVMIAYMVGMGMLASRNIEKHDE